MDFARKQLEKYGWTDGKGLGKHENGMSQALKPKLKRSVTGVGHDPASEFNEHWWTALYDKAAGNVKVEEKNGVTKKIKTKNKDEFVITNSTWKLNKKQNKSKNEEQYSDHFVRTAVLTSGGSKTEKVKDTESDEDGEEKRDVCKMTDEELFAACEGRTAHKGARHGLKALGKLARIAQQEAMLLGQPKYNGYSHNKGNKSKVVEDMNLNRDSGVHKKKKKKQKHCNINASLAINTTNNSLEAEKGEYEISKMRDDKNVACTVNDSEISRKTKSKKKKRDDKDIFESKIDVDENVTRPNIKKKRQVQPENVECMETNNTETKQTFVSKKKSKKNRNAVD